MSNKDAGSELYSLNELRNKLLNQVEILDARIAVVVASTAEGTEEIVEVVETVEPVAEEASAEVVEEVVEETVADVVAPEDEEVPDAKVEKPKKPGRKPSK